MILAVTHRKDEHARPVLDALARQGARAVVLDLALLPSRGRLALAYGGPAGSRLLRLEGAPPIDASRVRSVWWRRPQPPRAPRGLRPARADFSVRQTFAALGGLLGSLDGALCVNEPWRDDAATHKTLQLAAAERAGLAVPPTLVTNDLAAARAFVRGRGRAGAVHKLLDPSKAEWRRTARLRGPRDAALRGIGSAPLILQEHVPGVDVRVTAVGDELFAAEIDARRSPSPDDYRGFEDRCRFAACRLPPRVEAGLRALLADLDLRFAAVDLRRRDDGAWLFLEVNPAGQWLWVERRTGQPITAALAALLAGGAGG